MLTSGKQSQEEARIQSVLQRLSGITFIPNQWNETIFWETFEETGFTKDEVLHSDDVTFFQKFIDLKWPWDQIEHFADILIALEQYQPNQYLKERAKKTYQFILNESKMYSFQITSKISQL